MTVAERTNNRPESRTKGYTPPLDYEQVASVDLVPDRRLGIHGDQQQLSLGDEQEGVGRVYVSGKRSLLKNHCVSVIGTRSCTEAGKKRARKLARELVSEDVVVVSGLAEGIDTSAHRASIEEGGDTVAVIGTPMDKAYPADNRELQEEIWQNHLLVSPFEFGGAVYPSHFPKRNRVMSFLSDASVVIEAGEQSGTQHQAKAASEQGRWLFFTRSMIEQYEPDWALSYLENYEKCSILTETKDVLEVVK